MFKYELGSKAKDTVTGYIGIINMRSQHLNGCNRYSIQASIDKEGKIPESYWFDENSIEILEAKKIKHKPVLTGGPHTRSK